jgi:hypothetical protein
MNLINKLNGLAIVLKGRLLLTAKSIVDSAKASPDDGGSFSNVSKAVDDLGGAGYKIVFKAGIYIGLVMIMAAGIGLIVSNSNTRNEKKSSIIWKIVGIVMVVAAPATIILLESLGKGLFSSAN